ncbi:MAG: transporter substrate-binding domain-containing protein [Gammaproteobacteria bacterium]|nr:MAG: transporter substrate-binding domain-containing protein [Gammaproteobacteria bacterium]
MRSPNFSNRWIVFLSLTSLAGVLPAQVADDEAMREALTPTGTLRAAFLGRNPVQVRVDPQTGEVTGPAADVARELGRRIGVSLTIQLLSDVPAVIDAVSNGSADIGFIAYDTTRAQRVAFTQAYVYGHNSYIVRADWPINTFADADREGTRIAANLGNAVDLFLDRTLENAELVHLARGTPDEEAARMLLAGEIDAYAANKQRLAAVVASEPRVRVLDGSVLPVEQSIVVAQENEAVVSRLDLFIDELRASGFLQEIVDRYMIAGVEVAPRGRR